MNDWQQAQAFFRTNPLKYLVHLKYMHLYGNSVTCTLTKQDDQWAVLLRYPSGRVVWDATAYPATEQVLMPAASNDAMAVVLLRQMQDNGLLDRSQVIKFCAPETEAVFKQALPLTFARSLTSYTNLADVHYEPDAAVRVERSPTRHIWQPSLRTATATMK